MASNEAVHREADAMLRTYVAFARQALGMEVVGVYLTGSYALDDLCPSSDVDFVTVLARPLRGNETEQATRWQRSIRKTYRRGFEGLYVLASELGTPPEEATRVLRCDGRELKPAIATPVDWELLRCYGVTVYGWRREALGIREGRAALRQYSHQNLSAYWEKWLKRFPRLPAVGPLKAPIAYLLAWGVLGVPRLHAAIATGEILSKSAAAGYARQAFGERWEPAITASLAYRQRNDRGSIDALVKLRPSALDFIRTAIRQSQMLPV